MYGINFLGNSGEKKPGKIDEGRRSFLTLTAASAAAILTGCGGGNSGSTNLENPNNAPEIANNNINYEVVEGGTKTVAFSKIIADAKITDSDNNTIILEPIAGQDSSIVVNNDNVVFTAPLVSDNTSYELKFRVKDSKGEYAAEDLIITFTASNIPFNFENSDIEFSTENVPENSDFTFSITPDIDDNNVDMIYYSINDKSDGTKKYEGTPNKGEEITISNIPVGNYSMSVLVQSIGGDSKTVTKSFNVVADIPVEITDINISNSFTQGDNISGTFKVPETSDETISVEYKIVKINDDNTEDTIFSSGNLYPNQTINYTVADFDTTGLDTGNYVVRIRAENEGNTPASTKVVDSQFEILAPASWNTADLDQEIEDNKNGERNGLPRFDDSDEKTIIENISDFLRNSNDPIELLQDGIDDLNGGKIYPIEIQNGNLILKANGMGSLADQSYTFKLKSGNAIYEKTIFINNN